MLLNVTFLAMPPVVPWHTNISIEHASSNDTDCTVSVMFTLGNELGATSFTVTVQTGGGHQTKTIATEQVCIESLNVAIYGSDLLLLLKLRYGGLIT